MISPHPAPTPCLHICVTCGAETGGMAGARLYDEIAAIGLPEGTALAPVKCLSMCGRGIAGCLTDARKWSWLLSGLAIGQGGDLLAYLSAYARSSRGVVLPSRRPPSLAHAVCGRIPSLVTDAADSDPRP